MSYSFTVRAATKAEAKRKVAEELAKVVELQPVHAEDRPEAQAAADGFIDLVREDETKELQISVNGSLGWNEPEVFCSAGFSVSVYLQPKAALEPEVVDAEYKPSGSELTN